jgi:hypothetical protein
VIRAIRLARLLRADVRIAVDGPVPAVRVPSRIEFVRGGAGLVATLSPRLLVLDTPVGADAERWLRAGRRAGVPVASVHDRGIAPVASDLAIDGSLAGPRAIAGAARTLRGPRYMVVDPAVSGRRRPRGSSAVVVAFGGGTRASLARCVARRVRRELPHTTVRIAGGFAQASQGRPIAGVEWLGPQPSLAPLLASAAAAVVAGGVTLYEAAALGVPAVAVPVVAAQRPTVRAFAQAGLALSGTSAAEASASVARLLNGQALSRSMRRKGPRVVDGRGAGRVARALEALMRGGGR